MFGKPQFLNCCFRFQVPENTGTLTLADVHASSLRKQYKEGTLGGRSKQNSTKQGLRNGKTNDLIEGATHTKAIKNGPTPLEWHES